MDQPIHHEGSVIMIGWPSVIDRTHWMSKVSIVLLVVGVNHVDVTLQRHSPHIKVCVCVCMHVCVHVCMCVYICMYVCMCVYVCMYACMCVSLYKGTPLILIYACVCMDVCMHVCVHVCIYACMCVYVCMYVCMYACVYMYVCMYVSTYVCMYASTYVCECMYICMYACVRVWMYVWYHQMAVWEAKKTRDPKKKHVTLSSSSSHHHDHFLLLLQSFSQFHLSSSSSPAKTNSFRVSGFSQVHANASHENRETPAEHFNFRASAIQSGVSFSESRVSVRIESERDRIEFFFFLVLN